MAFDVITPVKLGQGAILATVSTLYTVPALTRALVKDITICNTTTGVVAVTVYLVPAAETAGAANALFSTVNVSPGIPFQLTGVQVMNAGGTIQTIASAVGCTINVSGGEAV